MRQGSAMRGREARDLDLLFGAGSLLDLSDGELLDRFVAARDEAAVAALVARHGGMVLGVCRRVLADPHDADDAFQATFLVLARRAGSVRPADQVARWLHGVALRTARKARSLRARRLGREVAGLATIAEVAAPPEGADPDRAEWLGRLDRAIAGLPSRYRAPVVLCLLEGRTHREAADLLGWPVGTVSGRLSRARALLARRVRASVGKGDLDPGPLALPALVAPPLPPGRVAATARALTLWGLGRPALTTAEMAPILLLTREVIRTMTMSKIKLVGALALGLALMAGGVGVALVPAAPDHPNTALDDAPTPDLAPLQGLWTGTIGEIGGQAQALPGGPDIQILVQGDRVSLRGIDFGGTSRLGPEVVRSFRATLRYPTVTDADKAGRIVGRRLDLDPEHARLIDLTAAPEPDDIAPTVHLGVYWVGGDNLRLVLSRPNKHRPTPLRTEAGTAQVLFVLRRTPDRSWGDLPNQAGRPSSEPALEVHTSTGSKTAAPADLLAEVGRSGGGSESHLDRQRSIRRAARAIAEAPEVTPDLIEPMRHLLDPRSVGQNGAADERLRFFHSGSQFPTPGSGVASASGTPLPPREPQRTTLDRLEVQVRPAQEQPAPVADAGEILRRGLKDRLQGQRVVEVPSDQNVDANLLAALARAGSWRVVRAGEVTKDAMILRSLPDWDRGDVDNLQISNQPLGNHTLVDWKPVPPEEAKDPNRRFFLAFYARTTLNGSDDPGPIVATELLEEWPERTSWRTRPETSIEAHTSFRFEPGDGWKLFDITPLMRERVRQNRGGRGIALMFGNTDPGASVALSAYKMVSREAEGEWRTKRPQLLVVEPLEPVARP